LREDLVSLIAHLEAYIDFPDEDIEPDVGADFLARLDQIGKQCDALLATADQGRIFREGVRVVIYGATNAGKSSLFNRLLGFPRAIVSETPGTTRDTIEELIKLGGIAFRVTDTAGCGATLPARSKMKASRALNGLSQMPISSSTSWTPVKRNRRTSNLVSRKLPSSCF
jgi:tRNA modification GTPase